MLDKHKPVFLVVDDDPMVRKVLSKGLQALEPEAIFEVEDGLQAQEILREQVVDVVVTDVLMPNMDGRELMKWAQEHAPGPMWIVLSGLDTFDAAVDALHLGAFDFLAKPAELQRVRVSVRNALDQLELKRDRERLYGELAESHDRLAEKVQQLEAVCHMLEEQADVIQADLKRAEVIQRALLPQVPPQIGRWCVETLYRPGSNVGGDYYDVVSLDDRHLGIIIADAAGHGVAAAMLAVLFKHRLQLLDDDKTPLSPKQVLARANASLFDDMTGPGMFITAVYALLDRRSGRLKIASAGHPPPVWVSADQAPVFFTRTGPAMGLREDAEYEEERVMLQPNDRLFLYTDGVIEGGPEAPKPEDFPAKLLDTTVERDALLQTLYNAAIQGVEEDRDDITMILLERSDGLSRFDAAGSAPEVREKAVPGGKHVQLLQGVADGRGYMSISGDGTWMKSGVFFDAANKLLKRRDGLTIDLGACEYLDSTFLGTIHEVAMSHPQAVRLQRVPPKIRALFEELDMSGVLALISVLADPLPEKMESLHRAEQDVGEQSRRVLRAHEILATLSDENQERFRGVVESLRADLDADREAG